VDFREINQARHDWRPAGAKCALLRPTRRGGGRRSLRKPGAGVTLMETMIVILLASVLMAIGVPSYRYITYSNRVSSEVNALLGDLQYARSEAVKEGQNVTVCPPNTAQTACGASTSWQSGWIVFSDVNSNQTVAATSDILRVQPAFTSTPRDTFTSNLGLTFVSFNREGFATSFPSAAAATGYATITLHTTPQTSQWTRCVQIFTTGLMGTEKTTDPQGNCL
jgi:type IV fimbrial biogenesis protein FimT